MASAFNSHKKDTTFLNTEEICKQQPNLIIIVLLYIVLKKITTNAQSQGI